MIRLLLAAVVAVASLGQLAYAGEYKARFVLINGVVTDTEAKETPEPAAALGVAESAPAVRYVQVCDGRTCRLVAVPVEPVSTSAPVAAPSKTTAADCPCVASGGSCPCAGTTAAASAPVFFPRFHNAVESFRSNRPVLFPRLHALINR